MRRTAGRDSAGGAAPYGAGADVLRLFRAAPAGYAFGREGLSA